MNITKRDGHTEKFDITKISKAIRKAFNSVERETNDVMLEMLALRTVAKAQEIVKELSVEVIQDCAEAVLMECGFSDVAKSYVLYRQKRANIRNMTLDVEKVVEEYIGQLDWRVKENSTVSYSLGGFILSNSGAITSNYWLNHFYDEEIANAHRNCDMHIHDLSMLSGYCFTGDTKVKTLDGKKWSFKELVDSEVKELWVYAYDIENGKIVPTKAVNPRITREVNKLIAVELDNGQIIHSTEDHPFMLRDGSFMKAKMLSEGMSLMPLYISGENGETYLQISKKWTSNPDGKRMYVHRWVMEQILGRALNDDEVVHHVDGDKHNNEPTNLELMMESDHRSMELINTMNTEKWKTANAEKNAIFNKSEKKRAQVSEFASIRPRDEKGHFITINDPTDFTYQPGKDLKNKKFNHTIKSITEINLNESIPVYDLTVPGYHNFALDAGVFVHNCAGWSLKQLILEGLGGVENRITSKPAKHLHTLCNQMVNFLGIMQNEWAGAQAFSSFDTYLSAFVKADNLDYHSVKQCIQSFVFGVNTPSRWGCVDPSTEILTKEGFKKYTDLVKGEEIWTYNTYTNEFELQSLNEIVVKDHDGYMYSFKPYSMNGVMVGAPFHFVSPEHRMVTFDIHTSTFNIIHAKDAEMLPELHLPAITVDEMNNPSGVQIFNYKTKDMEKVPYKGIVWCPNVDNGTAIFRNETGTFLSGNCQAPFSNITLDWTCPEDLKDMPAIVGGQPQDFTYGDCDKERAMVNKAFLEVMIEGDANGRGHQYPRIMG